MSDFKNLYLLGIIMSFKNKKMHCRWKFTNFDAVSTNL